MIFLRKDKLTYRETNIKLFFQILGNFENKLFDFNLWCESQHWKNWHKITNISILIGLTYKMKGNTSGSLK